MIEEILRSISQDCITSGEMALRLNVTPYELGNRLKIMERMGYIRHVSVHTDGDQGAACAFCSRASICSKDGAKEGKTTVYSLTDKGKRACGH